MKISNHLTLTSFGSRRALARLAIVALPCLVAFSAHAASTSSNFNSVMAVNAPVCTVSTANATVTLPPAGSANQTLGNYYSFNGITTAGVAGAGWVTSAALNQTATISCTTASTPILSFVVAPATGFSSNGGASSYLVDTATTPNKAASGSMTMIYEQVSVNGTAAPFSYFGSTAAGTAYTTTFSTTAVANGIATVVWRPSFSNSTSVTNIMGIPTGGAFSSPGQVIVNY